MAVKGGPTNTLRDKALKPPRKKLVPPRTDAEFMEMWNTILADFSDTYFIQSDAEIIEQYISTCLEIKKISAQLEDEGPVVQGSHGPRMNPLSVMLSALRREQRGYARVLRVGPSSRVRQDYVGPQLARPTAEGLANRPTAKMNVVPIAGKK